MEVWKRDRIGSAERGENPTVIARMPSGFAVLGDSQFLPGYCVLLASPQVTHLSDLTMPGRLAFLRDMSLLGETIEQVCQPKRVNHEILGNTDPFVHAHIFPRYNSKPAEHLDNPVILYPVEQRNAPEFAFDIEKHGDLMTRLSGALRDLMTRAGVETA